MQVRYPRRVTRAIRASSSLTWRPIDQPQPTDVNVFAAREVRIYQARMTNEAFTWSPVCFWDWVEDPDLPVIVVARRYRPSPPAGECRGEGCCED
jgi:hypothetical protein